MKIVRCFLVSFFTMTVVCINLNGMEQEESKVIFRFTDSRELIELSTHLIEPLKSFSRPHRYNSYIVSHSLPIDISIFRAIVDCLNIIASGDDVQKRLLDFISFMNINHRVKVRKDFCDAARLLKFQQLTDLFNIHSDYAKKNIPDAFYQRLGVLLQEAKFFFEMIPDKDSSAVIIDVDGTALNCVPSPNKEVRVGNATWSHYPALEQVRDLYKWLVAFGFKIFFLTARLESALSPGDGYDAVVQNLQAEGYDVFEKVICIPKEERQYIEKQASGSHKSSVYLHGIWKETQRNKIAATYTVVGTLDDGETNLEGENTGYPVLIPSFF